MTTTTFTAPDEALPAAAAPLVARLAGGAGAARRCRLGRAGDRNDLFRVALDSGGGAPETVVLKLLRVDPARGFTDWASLAFLGELRALDGVAPRLIAGAHRSALAGDLPEARDDALVAAAWAELCAYRGLAQLTWVPLRVLEADEPWVEDWPAGGGGPPRWPAFAGEHPPAA